MGTSSNVAKLTAGHFAIQVCKKLGRAVAWADGRNRDGSLRHYAAPTRPKLCVTYTAKGEPTGIRMCEERPQTYCTPWKLA